MAGIREGFRRIARTAFVPPEDFVQASHEARASLPRSTEHFADYFEKKTCALSSLDVREVTDDPQHLGACATSSQNFKVKGKTPS